MAEQVHLAALRHRAAVGLEITDHLIYMNYRNLKILLKHKYSIN